MTAPDIQAMQDMLSNAFDEAGLTCFCFDHYPAVYRRYGAGMTFERKAQALLNHCRQAQTLADLQQRLNGHHPGPDFATRSPDTFPLTDALLADPAARVSQNPGPNPFGLTGRITNPAHFFDREGLLRQIFEELDKGVSLSLVGESQVGKSSLLEMICRLGPARMAKPPQTFAHLSLQWVANEADFYEALCDALEIEPLRGYRLFRALRQRRFILCLDEAEKMTWEGFTRDLRGHLRGLADGVEASMTLVIASRTPLETLFQDRPDMDSPLAGICRQLDVANFPLEVARAFLSHHLNQTGVTFSPAQNEALLAWSHGHPARLHRAAADLFRALTDSSSITRNS